MKYHPDVLAAHAEFGGDLQAMQALYDRPDHVARIAALEAQLAERVRVKPLKWSGGKGGVQFALSGPIVDGLGVSYSISPRSELWHLRVRVRDHVTTWFFNTEADAKAYAQADYERRILSALEATPAPKVTDALKAALTTMYRYQRAGCGDDVFYDDLSQSIRKVEAALTAAEEAGKP